MKIYTRGTASPKSERGFTPQSINDLFLRADTLITGIRNSREIQDALKTAYGYNDADFSALVLLTTRSRAQFQDTPLDGGTEALLITREQRTALAELGREVGKLRKYARRALTDQPTLLELLGLDGK